MKHPIFISFMLACASFASAMARETIMHVSANLTDGSTINAEFLPEHITGKTVFSEELKLSTAVIRTISFVGNNGEAKVELTNRDNFGIIIADEVFQVKSVLGEIAIPRDSLRALALRAVNGESKEEGLVYACSFDQIDGIASPECGPAGRMELGQLCPSAGRTGGALLVKPGIAGAQVVFPANTFGNNGCIEFWANLQSGKTEFSTGGDPRFLLLTTADGEELIHFEYASNDGCGHCGLTANVGNVRVYTHEGFRGMMPYSDIFKGEDFNGWHHYALSWTPENVFLYLDGKQLSRSTGTISNAKLSGATILDIPLNRKSGKSYNNKSAFLIDDLKIWNYAKESFDVE